MNGVIEKFHLVLFFSVDFLNEFQMYVENVEIEEKSMKLINKSIKTLVHIFLFV